MGDKKYKRGTTLEEWCNAEGREDILEQFDYERNYPKTPKDYTKGADAKVYFKYPCGHNCPPQRIADKTSKNIGCPLCLNRGAIGRSLANEYPEVAMMFDEKRNGISPKDVSRKNGKEYWWNCLRCRKSFRGKVAYVVDGSQGCKMCGNKRRTKPEYYLGYYLKKVDNDLKMDKKIDGYRFDFVLPSFSIAIEYDGYPWHNTSKARKNDSKKDLICKKQGITLIRLRDSRLKENTLLDAVVYSFNYDDKFMYLKEVASVLEAFVGDVAKNLDIDIIRDFGKINQFMKDEEGRHSLLEHMPCLSKYVDSNDERNGNPAYVTTATNKIRFWLRHPIYQDLKWSLTAHELFTRKAPETQWINMCIKVLQMYPELKEQVVAVGNHIREDTVFTLKCTCGRTFTKMYFRIIAKNRKKVVMCEECLLKYRINNLKAARYK